MGDDEKFVFHDRPDAPKPPSDDDRTLRAPPSSPAPEAAPAPDAPPSNAAGKVDQFIGEAGRKLTDEERAQAKVRLFSKAGLRQFVQDLIDELSRRTCEDHVREIADLREKIRMLEAGETIARLRKELEDEKATVHSDFNSQKESLGNSFEAGKKSILDAAESETAGRRAEIERELAALRLSSADKEAKLRNAQAALDRLNIELSTLQELKNKLVGTSQLSRAELEKIIAALKARHLELECELEWFGLEEEPDAEAVARDAEELAAKLAVRNDAFHESLSFALRRVGVDALAAAAKFKALRTEMHIGNGAIDVVVDMVRHLKDIEAARAAVAAVRPEV
jgi:hypothetical protein